MSWKDQRLRESERAFGIAQSQAAGLQMEFEVQVSVVVAVAAVEPQPLAFAGVIGVVELATSDIVSGRAAGIETGTLGQSCLPVSLTATFCR